MTVATMISDSDRAFSEVLAEVENICQTIVAEHASDVDAKARFPIEAFAALKAAKMLSAYVPTSYGGHGISISQVCKLCEVIAGYCASTAMIFAMHQIQVACIVHHCQNDKFFDSYLKDLVAKQLLLASATTELGIGGDVRSSSCAVEVNAGRFTLNKKAPVISYALASDAIMVTCRRSADAAANDQSIVLVKIQDCDLEQIAGWDTLGFRGTCSSGFALTSSGAAEQIVPIPYAKVLGQTMHPVAHLVWGSVWTGLAADAVDTARQTVRAAARKNPQVPPVTALRLAEVNELLFSMRSGLYQEIAAYQQMLGEAKDEEFENYGFAIRTNNVKIRCSELVVDVVGKALQIVGISGYKNDSKSSLARHIRDAYGAVLMVNNDRIRGHNATMQIAYKGS